MIIQDHLEFRCEDHPFPATCTWDSTDPYRVHIAFFTIPGSYPVEWSFSRDLLCEGLLGLVGDSAGDVWVARDEHRVVLVLDSPSGDAVLSTNANQLASFLARTSSIVPRGSESYRWDPDAELAELLREAA